jgi:hypothetical protein
MEERKFTHSAIGLLPLMYSAPVNLQGARGGMAFDSSKGQIILILVAEIIRPVAGSEQYQRHKEEKDGFNLWFHYRRFFTSCSNIT